MKLTAKIVSFWMAGTLIVVAAGTFFAIRHDVRLLQVNMRADAGEVGRTLAPLIQDAWQTSGEQRALQLLADANRDNRQLNVRWVWLDDPSAENPIAQFPTSQSSRTFAAAISFSRRTANRRGKAFCTPMSPCRSRRRGQGRSN